MLNKRKRRNTIITCSYTDCIKKDCPNHTPFLKSDSIPFSSCMYKPTNKNEK